jgi:hypothetical protein
LKIVERPRARPPVRVSKPGDDSAKIVDVSIIDIVDGVDPSELL